ncbi:shikimate dehydrogenase family protein [Devosia rhizoryzae]|uniref:Shikimate dehydrogenase n=1 Tax=Devosia rhizoryzae TaxID=2774137 RepID=A0ABX7C2L9_9HYPH|nr:shikimate dehydrogenase [Devosia rhizoryzae]QQR38475.1 shikimate dehydrogenase [Devosia rhizoryzae]
MSSNVSGTTTVIPMVGHPVQQVHMPGVINDRFRDKRIDAVMVPMDILPEALPHFAGLLRSAGNIPGAVITLPHKVAMAGLADRLTPRAHLLGAANVVSRQDDGTLLADMLDGSGMIGALSADNVPINGQQCWVIGAGAAGSAIALALAEAGAAEVWISDLDAAKASAIAARFATAGHNIIAGEPGGLEVISLVVNATTAGMGGVGSALPSQSLAVLPARCCIADVVTKPNDTPLLRAARDRGLRTISGDAMAEAQTNDVARFMGYQID